MATVIKILKQLTLVILGIVCLILFKLIGSSVDESGFLHEAFVLVIIGWFLIGLGIINFTSHCIICLFKRYPEKIKS